MAVLIDNYTEAFDADFDFTMYEAVTLKATGLLQYEVIRLYHYVNGVWEPWRREEDGNAPFEFKGEPDFRLQITLPGDNYRLQMPAMIGAHPVSVVAETGSAEVPFVE